MFNRLIIVSQLIIAASIAGCATTAPPAKPIPAAEKVKMDQAVGLEMAKQLDPQLVEVNLEKRDPELRSYLDDVARKLADTIPQLRMSEVQVQVVSGRQGSRDSRWINAGLPGGRLYVSAGLLKTLDYEAEVAAALAFQLGHVQLEHPTDYFHRNGERSTVEEQASYGSLLPLQQGSLTERIDFFGPRGVFSYGEQAEIEACEAAIRMMYSSGFDPRGMTSLLERFKANKARSPFEVSTVEKLLEASRRAIALHSPLRNPIVRSQAFIAIRQRIQKL